VSHVRSFTLWALWSSCVRNIYVVSLLFASLCYFLITRFMVFNMLFMFIFLFCMIVFYFVNSVFLYCCVYCFSFCVHLLFPMFVQVYRPLPPGGNPIALNKYIVYTINFEQRIGPVPLTEISFKPTHNNRAGNAIAGPTGHAV
jgi:hypothetical protein